AALEHVVDQQFYRVGAVARGGGVVDVAARQHVEVHAAPAQRRVIEEGGDAGAQQGDQRHRLVRGQVVRGQDADRVRLQRGVVVAAGGRGDDGAVHAPPVRATAR